MLQIGIRLHDVNTTREKARQTMEERARTAKAEGFSCVHLALSKVIEGTNFDEAAMTEGLAMYIKRVFGQNGLDVAVLGCYLNLAHPDREKLKQIQAKYYANIRVAALSGACMVGTETGAPNAAYKYEPACHGQTALRVGFAEEQIRDSLAAHGSGEPDLHYGTCCLALTLESDGAAAQEHYGYRLAQGCYLFEQFGLDAGHVDVAAACRFPTPIVLFAKHNNYLIGAAGGSYGSIESAAVVADGVAAPRIHRVALSVILLDGVQYALHTFGGTGGPPAAQQVVGAVGKFSYHSDAAAFLQRQDAVVLQKNSTFLRHLE